MRLNMLSRLSLVFFACLVAQPGARAEPVPQQLTNNAPFSGAVYIVTSDGQQVTAQDGNWCPSSASQSCSSVNQPSWCCPANYACVAPEHSNGLIGCCPQGSSCGGVVNVAQVTTVTVYPQQQTAIVYGQPAPPVTTVHNNPNQAQGGFCATITMDGPGLPRAQDGDCGTILIVSEGTPGLRTIGIAAGMVAVMLHIALGRMFARN